ncbi:radical SAM protein [Mycobacterium kansasii]|uniref:radical SAM protein n=1 Tax=Mycobacterium kansasii TaxID=1768 RepID=UPI000CDD2D08|nr:radical SAM protein [Mycobacterium kansasii]POX78982.1 radical SAM protein [Mycobacterium kansasii]POX92774.1 radical SAM protein [Mycobacterium kansasii]POX94449.1 radical SAM protein [Mycobacterium kansasii]POY11352.1 radical SAM protein [Mycobacterium kansasii]POY16983.1 radical SAM protein [Mycobacterium kansasii]
MDLRGDSIHRYVNAFCPRCHDEEPDRPLSSVARLSGWLAVRDGLVWLERGCRSHGLVRTLYDEDPEILAYLEEWTAPTKAHIPDTPGNFDPIPSAYLRGLPQMQTQHTCILLEDIAETCNLRCPTCFADSSPDLRRVVAIGDVLANVDQRLERENGRLDVLMLSGGEPSLHPQLPEVLAELSARPITRILLNTNGIRVAQDDGLLDVLTEHRERAEVYLQYDGLSQAAHRYHRGGDLRRIKQDALRRLSERQIFTTLVMTAALGVNDHEIGDVVRLALRTPYAGGVCIQPQFGSGRSGFIDADNRLTHTGVLRRLGPQTDDLVTWRDLTALPCSHPHCCSVGYLLRDDGGRWRSLVALIGHDNLKDKLGLVANRIADRDIPRELRLAVRESLLALLSEQSSLSHPQMSDVWRLICQNCDLGMATLLTLASSALPGRRRQLRRLLGERVLRITVKPFMDMSTMIEERLVQCCVHVGTRSSQDQCAPFCAVQAWPALGRQRLSVAAERLLPVV